MLGPADLIIALAARFLPSTFHHRLQQIKRPFAERAAADIPRSNVTIVLTPDPPQIRFPYALVATCKNEADSLKAWIESVERLSLPPAEIVLCDAGSSDQTVQLLRAWAARRDSVKIISRPGANIATGRNAAAREATQSILVFSDLGTTLAPDWAARLVAPLKEDPEVEVAMGYYDVDVQPGLLRAISRLVTPRLETIDPATFLPSARSVAMTRDVFERAGGYPEHLTDAGEDSLFDIRLKKVATKLAFVPTARVRWKAPGSYLGMFRMITRYARGDAEGEMFWRHYLWLVGEFGKAVLELFFGAVCLSASVIWIRAAGALLLFFAMLRIYKTITRFPVTGARGFLAASTVAVAQTFGFLRGISFAGVDAKE